MRRIVPARSLLSGLALLAMAGCAGAQTAGHGQDDEAPRPPLGWSRGTVVQGWPDPLNETGRCVRWCAADLAPCDPDYYKVADKRCNPNQSGYY